MTFPAFLGVVGETAEREGPASLVRDSGWRPIRNFSPLKLALWTRNADAAGGCCWRSTKEREMRPAVFVWGQPLVASDCEFGAETTVERIASLDLPDRIACLYQEHGTGAFARLEGNFCLVVCDPASQSIFLAVDKLGCDDIYVRRRDRSFAFASHPSLLAHPLPRFDARATAFFLAHEGFVPAPFTLFEGIKAVGRAKLLRIRINASGLSVESERYGSPLLAATETSRADAVDEFHRVLASAVTPRCRARNGILLSGGVDSALLANIIANRRGGEILAMTGAVRGHAASEWEVRCAAELSSTLGIAHHPVYLDPQDEALPEEWANCTSSWSGGTRITLSLFYRFAMRMRERLGEGYSAFSGQMADTLADNNYTLPSLGYTMRRMCFSSWFLKIMAIARRVVPHKNSRGGLFLARTVKACAGPRIAEMAASLLDGLSSNERFYEGRVFGFGEMPGRSSASFPVLSENGFESIADWYSSSFVAPVVSRLTPETFYADMMELSMEMGMLHLDTRLVLHAFRLGGGNAELPFLDSRMLKFFASLPYSARAFYRRPKYVIDAQFAKHGYVRAARVKRNGTNRPSQSSGSRSAASFEETLLVGSLGSYFRELLGQRSALDHVPGVCEFIDEGYLERQMRTFRRGLTGVDYKFIARVAALELWSQTCQQEAAFVSRASAIA
ncbi:MAG: asparagine synthase-related protein [Candidatus Acidiferrales bacterium]